MSDRNGRPSPEALLKTIQQGLRGKLKIFLGAAPGVGKTYEMLTSAHGRLREGVDVVVGVVEAHGRAETEALVAGLPVIARKIIDYKGRQLDEMDLDAILARHPALVLVDELAHTNAPGSRHTKRYHDVEELLAAGIDVYSTLNIQHVESLNDVVAQITRIRVRETVPDSVIDTAAEIEVIDLTPDDLIQRLRDGKVYVAKTATRALGHYFSPGNLTALRELALRRTAQRVDAQLLDHMQAHAIQGPWAAGDRILVCIDHRGGQTLVRYGRRMAERLRVPWAVIHVETEHANALPEVDRDRIAETMRLAERLGAQSVTIPGTSVAADVVAYAREHNFTHIVVGAMERSRWWRRSIPEQMLRAARDIPVHVVGTKADAATTAPNARTEQHNRLRATPVLASMAMVAGATLIGSGLRHVMNSSSVEMVFLTAVLLSAATYGLIPSLFACLAATLAYNFFFLEPLYSFTIADPENVVALFFFTLTAVIASNLAARMRAQAVSARARAKTTEELYQFSRKLAGIGNLDDLLWATAYQIAAMLKLRVVLLLPESRDGQALGVRGAYPPEDALDEADLAAAEWAWQSNRPTGRGSDTLPGARRLFLPLRTGSGPVAIVGIDRDESGPFLTPDQRRLLDALGDQAAVSIERMVLAENVEQSRLTAETERLRGALLTSLSHDLRTPLASILGAADTLQSYRSALAEEAQAELLATIADEAERMGRFVANLLDMTRLESGAVAREREPHDLGELIGSTLARARKILSHHRLTLDLEPDLPILQLDAVLLEQVIFNLLDNAAKYAPPGSDVTLRAWHDAPAQMVKLQIIDEGPGIPPDYTEAIFEKFFRVHATDRARAGTGLGLAICRGFVESMGGRIVAGNRTDRSGAVFTLSMPVGIASIVASAA